MSSPIRIAGLFDVSLGYGSPQAGMLLQSLARHYGPSRCVALEPDQKNRAMVSPWPDVEMKRFGTIFPPHDEVFQIEYNRQLVAFVDDFAPHLIVVQSAWTLPALLMHRGRAGFCVYYMLESLSHQTIGGGAYALDLNAMARDHVDLVLTPERRRAELDLEFLGWTGKPVGEILNAGERAPVAPSRARVGDSPRFLYAGSIGASTLCDLFLEPELAGAPIDVWGPTDTAESRALTERMGATNASVRYRGFIGAAELAERRRDYAFSLCAWRPDNLNQLLACPNKFFESIAAGVPPICAPHPQCVEIIRRYDCGVIMRDWSVGALAQALQEARAIYASSSYEAMVASCLRAAASELNWQHQFATIAPLLPSRDALLERTRA